MARHRQSLRTLWIGFLGLFLAFASGDAQSQTARSSGFPRSQLPRSYIPTGDQIYKDYCAACHGADGKGHGPMSGYLTSRPADLTALAKSHGGSFPEQYVADVLRFGFGLPAHGTSEMPIWGPIFQQIDNYNEAAVRRRIQNLCEYLNSIQQN